MLPITSDHQKRLFRAYQIINWVLKRYGVEWRAAADTDIWLEIKDQKDDNSMVHEHGQSRACERGADAQADG